MNGGGWTRRAFVFLPAAVAGTRGRVYPPQRLRYVDPSTEFPVERLTSPDYSSRLHAVSRRRFLLYSNDRTGTFQVFQLDLKTAQSRQLTAGSGLDGRSVALLSADDFLYFDGPVLVRASAGKKRHQEVYRVPEGFRRAPGLKAAPDGSAAAFVETAQGVSRIRIVSLPGATVLTALETAQASQIRLRPGKQELLYRDQGAELRIVNYGGREQGRVPAGSGTVRCARWSPDGATVLYLLAAERRVALCECDPAAGEPRTLANTSDYAAFAVNADASVFAGASASKASPYVYLMLRATRREATLCEHRASDPAMVKPEFSHNSQRLFFTSDRDGKPAIYSVNLERMLEET